VGYTYDACGNRISRTIILNTRETRAAAKQNDISLSDSFSGHQITLKPVSPDGTVVIEVAGLTRDDHCTASVYSSAGQLVCTASVMESATRLSLSSQPAGYYILWIDLNGDRQSWKIIKK
jgi:hypothetical protein